MAHPDHPPGNTEPDERALPSDVSVLPDGPPSDAGSAEGVLPSWAERANALREEQERERAPK